MMWTSEPGRSQASAATFSYLSLDLPATSHPDIPAPGQLKSRFGTVPLMMPSECEKPSVRRPYLLCYGVRTVAAPLKQLKPGFLHW